MSYKFQPEVSLRAVLSSGDCRFLQCAYSIEYRAHEPD